jgi:hypothetical protein
MTVEEAQARATHYRALAEQNIGRVAYEGLLTLAIAYEAYVARLDQEVLAKSPTSAA